MKIYTLTIAYNEEKEEVEYIEEELQDDSETITERGTIILNDYFDEEGLELISGSYIIGEA
jgi:hypothetical protein